MALTPQQKTTAMFQVQSAAMAERKEGEAMAAMAEAEEVEAARPKRGRPFKDEAPKDERVIIGWMVRKAGMIVTTSGCLQVRAGQVIDDPSLRYDLEMAEIPTMPVYAPE